MKSDASDYLVKLTDDALYQAKQQGRDRYEISAVSN